MRMTLYSAGVFLGATKTDYIRKSDGQASAFYNVSVKQGPEVGTIPCSKAIYDQYQSGSLQDFSKCDFVSVFDDKYNRLQVMEVQPTK
ncbi:MAG: hypothetical protein HFI33_15290 [Lachnospiraceae bacterium]|nr:hypothetical protein [Lachnospiraceae bacterium]